MRIAIHDGTGWTQQWYSYCDQNDISYDIVDGYAADIISKLKSYDAFFWHIDHSVPTDILTARNVLFAAEQMGLVIFPNYLTSWHFDDKVSQKYLLESVDAPVVKSWAFYDKQKALSWLKNEAHYPLVAKLRRGAGSYNVKLIHDYKQGKKYSRKLFGSGVVPTPGYLGDIKNKIKLTRTLSDFKKKVKKVPGFFKMVSQGRQGFPKERSYVYFQEFIPGNKYDYRIAIVDNKAWAFKRRVRDNDFRASGSGMIDYDINDIPISLISKSFDVAKALGTQSIAFDYVKDDCNNFYIVEISFGFEGKAIYSAPGYFKEDMTFVQAHLWPEHVLFESIISREKEK